MTQIEIDNLIEKVNKDNYITVYDQIWYNIDDKILLSADEFISLIPYFNKITIKDICISYSWRGDIYTDLSKLKNLQRIDFFKADLTGTEEYIEKSLPKLQNIKILKFFDTKLTKFPDAIFELKNLEYLTIYNSIDNLTNLHFFRDGYSKNLSEALEDAFQLTIQTANYKKFKWGYKFSDFIIVDNDLKYLTSMYEEELDIDVLFLNTKNQNQNYKAILTVFNAINEKRTDYSVTKPNKLFYTTNYAHEFYDVPELIQKFKIGEKTHYGKFIDKILIAIGGEELLIELKNEKQREQVFKTLDFEKENKHITSLQINNFKLFNSIEINNLDKINILIGQNGSGKTSLLQAIAIDLIPQATMEWIPREQGYYQFIKSIINKKVVTEDIYAEIKLKWNTFERELRIYPYSVNANKEIPQTYLALGYGENLFTSKQSTSGIYIDELASGVAKTYYIETLFNDYNISLPNPLDILNGLEQQSIQKYSLNQQKDLIEISNCLQSIINKFLMLQSSKKYSIKKMSYGFYFVDSNNVEFSLYEISEGFRTNIVLITDIVVKILSARKNLFLKPVEIKDIFKIVNGTILIDEFDKHLHPVWQRTFLSALKEVFPNIQFILTTHNVVALQSAEGHKAFILNENGNVELKEIPIGYSIEALYRNFFDSDYFSENVTKNIKEFQKIRDEIIKKNDFSLMESEKYKKLLEMLQISSQTRMIAKIEENQLLKLKENAQTK